ncbi:MAG: hypothetical protein P4M02_05765 [Clostridia bacterium]|nr:hypothetical protein [Clostridia bacterium]
MSIYKETAIAVPALALLLFVSHTFFGPDESYRRLTTNPKSWLGGAEIPAERFIAKDLITGCASSADKDPPPIKQEGVGDLTPEARIRSVFAQFEPSERRRAT